VSSFDDRWRALQERRAELLEAQRRSDEAYFERKLRFNQQMGYAGYGIIASVVLGPAAFFLAIALAQWVFR
jgi:hypothetical protein